MTQFTKSIDADGVATLTWDTPGKSMNVMNLEGFQELDALIDEVLADDAVKGVILTSGKEGSFAGGMDLNIIAKMKESAGDNPAKGLFDGIMATHAILRKIERGGMDDKNKGGKPIVAGFSIPVCRAFPQGFLPPRPRRGGALGLPAAPAPPGRTG